MNPQNTQLVKTFGSQTERLNEMLKSCPREMWEFKPAPEHWCIREILHHLADSELNFVLRIRFALGEPGSPVRSFKQEEWGKNLRYADRYPETAIALFEALVQDTHGLLLEISDDDLEKTVNHSERGPLTVAYLTGFCDVHLQKHLDQIWRRLNEWKAANGRA